jgi:V/A-type H+-transporting ATPase subunit E
MTLDEKLDHFYSSVIESATRQNIEIVEEYKKTLQKKL